MFRNIILGLIQRKLKEPTTYAGLVLGLAAILHTQFSGTQITDFENLAMLIVGVVFVYLTEHKPPTADQLKAIVDAGATAAKDSIKPAARAALLLCLTLPLLAGCGVLQKAGNNGAWLTVQSKAGTAFCGKDYDPTNVGSRKMCQGLVLVAAGEAASDRVTHGDTADAPFVSGFLDGIGGNLDTLSSAESDPFVNADELNFERKIGAAGLRVVKREVSFIQLATASITTGVAAASGGSALVAAAASGGGWLLPDFIGQPATLAADYAAKLIAFQSDASTMVSAVKAGTMKPEDAWAAIKKRNANNKAAVDALSKAQ